MIVYAHTEVPPGMHDPDRIEVGMGEIAVAEYPRYLMTPALGSCVGIAVYDRLHRRGALAHVMLPRPMDTVAPGIATRFASVAVDLIVEELIARGSLRRRLEAKIAGGAAMFRGDARFAAIGERNIAEVRERLELAKVPIVAEDVGGSHARTIELRLESGTLVVRSYLYGIDRL